MAIRLWKYSRCAKTPLNEPGGVVVASACLPAVRQIRCQLVGRHLAAQLGPAVGIRREHGRDHGGIAGESHLQVPQAAVHLPEPNVERAVARARHRPRPVD
jgi:hypothetical protein